MVDKFVPNDASSDKWVMVLPFDLQLVTNKVSDFEIPGLSIDGTIGPRAGNSATMFQISGDTVSFDPSTFTFVVDEDYTNYIAVAKRMLETPYKDTSDVVMDIEISLLNNRGSSKSGVVIKYIGARFVNLSSVSLDTNAQVKTLACTVTFQFQDMEMYKGGKLVLSSQQTV